ncbi:MurR/RpiR family transcriptional regulator, partial [Listeria monocytogenes]|nr:MurR/RpiR family transcriptional regulator [Listeria monocytogenes]
IDILFYYYASHHYDEMIQQIKHSREATNRFRE